MIDQTEQPFRGPIAYLTGEYPRATDTFIQREVMALRKRGIDIVTCSIRRTSADHHVGPEQREEARNTFCVIAAARSPMITLRSHASAIFHNPGRYVSALGLALRTGSPGLRALIYQIIYFAEAVVLSNHLKRNGVVHLHNHIATSSCTVAMLASAISGIPYSFTVHGPDIFFEPKRWRLDEKISRASFIACISEYCRSQAMIFSDPIHWPKLHIVHCGVDVGRYADAAENVRRSNETGGQRLLFVGRLSVVKGLSILFAALKTLRPSFPNLEVRLIGDGPERAKLEDETRSLGIDNIVEFAGYKSQDEVTAALQETDILILPSFAEGLPVVLMEAMASRVPVITTRIAGVPELVEDGVHGFLIPPGDVDAIEHAIRELMGDPAQRASMGEAACGKVTAEFNIEYESAWLAGLFEAYVSASERPAKRPAAQKRALQPEGCD